MRVRRDQPLRKLSDKRVFIGLRGFIRGKSRESILQRRQRR